MKLITSFWTVFVIGVFLSLMILSFGYFHYWKPYNDEARLEQIYADQLGTEGAKLPQAKNRVVTANRMVTEREAAWQKYVTDKTPPDNVRDGGIDLSVNPYQLAIDSWKYRNNLQRAVNAQIVKGGITLVGTGPTIPGPTDVNNVGGLLASYYNYPTIKFPVVIFNLGQITVQGNMQQIMANVRSYKTMPHYLAVADGLRLDGTAPKLTGTYSLTIVGFIRAKKIFGSVPEAASSSAGGFGGFGGGMGRGGGRGPGGPGGPGMMGPGGPGGPGGPMGRNLGGALK
jgi:hypothetical protein